MRFGRGFSRSAGGVWVRKPKPADAGSGITVTRVTPASGNSYGGNAVTVTGSGFTGATSVSFGGIAATNVSVTNDTTITCTTPAGTAGKVAVSVDGNTLNDAYVYRGATYTVPTPTGIGVRNVYCHASTGNDSNDGLSTGAAKQSLDGIAAILQAGDTVHLAGTFTGQDFRPSVSGTASNWIKVQQWSGQAQAVVDGDNSGNGYGCLYMLGRSYYYFEGLYTGTSAPPNGGDLFTARNGTTNMVVKDCRFPRAGTVGVRIDSFGGAQGATNNIWIVGCTFVQSGQLPTTAELNTGEGIYVADGAEDVYIIGNTIGDGTAGFGHAAVTLGLYNAPNFRPCKRLTFAYNTVENDWAGGLNVNGTSQNVVCEGNWFEKIGTEATSVAGSKGAIFVLGSDGIYRYNVVKESYEAGISLGAYFLQTDQHCTGNHIHNNTCWKAHGTGCALAISGQASSWNGQMRNNIIENNIFELNCFAQSTSDTAKWGYKNGLYYAFVVDLYNAHTGAYNEWYISNDWTLNEAYDNIVRHNVFYLDGTYTDRVGMFIPKGGSGGADGLYATIANFETQFADEGATGNVGTSAQFADTGANQFWPGASSPALNAGYATTGVVYFGSAPDIGAYERYE